MGALFCSPLSRGLNCRGNSVGQWRAALLMDARGSADPRGSIESDPARAGAASPPVPGAGTSAAAPADSVWQAGPVLQTVDPASLIGRWLHVAGVGTPYTRVVWVQDGPGSTSWVQSRIWAQTLHLICFEGGPHARSLTVDLLNWRSLRTADGSAAERVFYEQDRPDVRG